MIVGNGDIASAIKDRKDLLFFVSGVSNSKETRGSEFRREIELLLDQDKNSHIVYVSTLSVLYSDTPYTRHKRHMEQLVKGFKTWTIFRLGNITWGTNPRTLINYLRNRHQRGLKLDIQDVYRYIVDKDEFQYWLEMIPDWSCEIGVPGRRMKVKDIVNEFVYNHS